MLRSIIGFFLLNLLIFTSLVNDSYADEIVLTTELRVAAGEALKINQNLYPSDFLEILENIVDQKWTEKTRSDYEALSKNSVFFKNFILQSDMVSRLNSIEESEPFLHVVTIVEEPKSWYSVCLNYFPWLSNLSCFYNGKLPTELPEFNDALQFTNELLPLPSNWKLAALRSSVYGKAISALSHPEVVLILSAFDPSDYSVAFDLLSIKLATSMEFFNGEHQTWVSKVQENYPRIFQLVSHFNPKLKIEEPPQQSARITTIRGLRSADPSQVLTYLDSFYSNNKILSSEELAEVLTVFPLIEEPVESDQVLIPLRNALRLVTYNEWTASDLMEMKVSKKIAVLSSLLNQMTDIKPNHLLTVRISLAAILSSSSFHDIDRNPNKPKLPSPIKRGISAQAIRNYFLDLVERASSNSGVFK